MPTKGSSKTETDLMRPSRIQTGLARCVTWSITQSEVQILCSPPIYTALWESSANPPARHAGDRRFESGQSRQKVFVCGVNVSICQGSGWIPDRQGLNLSGCRITVVSVAWDHVAKVRLLLLRPICPCNRIGIGTALRTQVLRVQIPPRTPILQGGSVSKRAP